MKKAETQKVLPRDPRLEAEILTKLRQEYTVRLPNFHFTFQFSKPGANWTHLIKSIEEYESDFEEAQIRDLNTANLFLKVSNF